MKLVTIVITRNKSCHVRTLHTLLQLNLLCMQNGIQQEIAFCKDNPFEKNILILKKIKECDRLLFIDYATQPDQQSLVKLLSKFGDWNCLVCPCVKEGIDWENFKKNVVKNTSEPVEQIGLDFDTEVGQKIDDSTYVVLKTDPKCWAIDSSNVFRKIKEKKKGVKTKLPVHNEEMFDHFKKNGVRIAAYTKAHVLTVFSHECLGNILNAAGVTHTPH